MYNKIKKEVKAMNGEEGGFNPGKLWKLKSKLAPRKVEPPSAMRNKDGDLLATDKKIKEATLKHFTDVFESKPIDIGLKAHKADRDRLCEERLKAAAHNKTAPWTDDDVKIAIKHLNSGISKDPHGQPNELFKPGIAGEGLIKALTRLMNKIKENPQHYPPAMDLCNVTMIYKNKGDISSFDSHRGVFRTTVLRNILDRLIYDEEYETIDMNLTDCNVGSRKKRNIRDNIFVMNAIMNSSKRGIDQPCDICVYDVRKCFDSLWLEECINDLFEAGLTNDKLCLLYYQNRTARIAINTPSGKTERVAIHKTVMQGTVWAGLMCTCTMDKLGSQAYGDPNLLYKYRGEVNVPPLQMVDDVIMASKCGNQVVTSNSAVSTFMKLKKLDLSETKCARIHIGKSNCDKCPTILVNDKVIKKSEKEKYLGDYLTEIATATETIKDRKKRAMAY